ncbi:hypothetical protein [Pedobacter sp. SYSU D00535]|uniref:hypothetical protein n=1 Tax=Pedobacter sp. SYSU D00535 TaxID=2810308 RepID=UPI001A965F1F|nr:hypothetical protein [Pedobacter sp. SYSU D00535]
MMDIDEDKDLPWSVYIDDLEAFLLALKRLHSNPIPQFKKFLRQRRMLHGRAYASDEMDVCGAFLSNPKLFEEIAQNQDASAEFAPTNQKIFDELYFSGLGFKDEISIENKRKRPFSMPPKISATILKRN